MTGRDPKVVSEQRVDAVAAKDAGVVGCLQEGRHGRHVLIIVASSNFLVHIYQSLLGDQAEVGSGDRVGLG